MASIYRTTGGFWKVSTDGGTSMSLATIEARLGEHPCAYRGLATPRIAPVTPSFTYVVVAVSDADAKTPKFPYNGYYCVVDLTASDAAFLFEPEHT
jgi:hypothetical protein